MIDANAQVILHVMCKF